MTYLSICLCKLPYLTKPLFVYLQRYYQTVEELSNSSASVLSLVQLGLPMHFLIDPNPVTCELPKNNGITS